MSQQCEFCNKVLATKGALKIHQTRTVKCLEKQKEIGTKIVDESYPCEYCHKLFLVVAGRDKHQLTCVKKIPIEQTTRIIQLEEEVEKLKERLQEANIDIARLTERVEIYEQIHGELKQSNQELKQLSLDEFKDTKKSLLQLASKPTTTNNTQLNILNQMTPLDLSEQRIIDAVANYTMEHYLKGPAGTVEWLIPNLLTDEKSNLTYRCNDKNRGHFFHKNADGERVEDMKGEYLINSVKPHMLPKLKEYKRIRNEAIMAQYGDDDENYQGAVNLISRKQNENKLLAETALGPETIKLLVGKVK